ncbi:Hypothetical predicted protein, partial [Pelobates cultripes]
MLARRLKRRIEAKQIHKIRTQAGQLSNNPDRIGETFHSYFAALYNHSPTPKGTEHTDETAMTDFVDKLNLPTLTETARATLAGE